MTVSFLLSKTYTHTLKSCLSISVCIFLHITPLYAKDTTTKTDGFTILGSTDTIFPKSKSDSTINPVFKVKKFDVHTALTNKSVQFKSSEKYGGTNTQFAMPKKPVDTKKIPNEIKGLLFEK